MKMDGTVWTWWTATVIGGFLSENVDFRSEPEKVMEEAILVTGGWYNHAALKKDGSVWTWGYNQAGNCGVADVETIKEPTMVAENAVMVWTGSIEYNMECQTIEEFQEIGRAHV